MASLAWQLARRYRSTRNSSGFIRFISASSTSGIALGVAILILALSVMNGFEADLKRRILGVLPHLVVSTETNAADATNQDWPAVLQQQDPTILQVSPFLQAEALIQSSKQLSGTLLQGVDVNQLPQFLQSFILTFMVWLVYYVICFFE